jgi:hypothetical protein
LRLRDEGWVELVGGLVVDGWMDDRCIDAGEGWWLFGAFLFVFFLFCLYREGGCHSQSMRACRLGIGRVEKIHDGVVYSIG